MGILLYFGVFLCYIIIYTKYILILYNHKQNTFVLFLIIIFNKQLFTWGFQKKLKFKNKKTAAIGIK